MFTTLTIGEDEKVACYVDPKGSVLTELILESGYKT